MTGAVYQRIARDIRQRIERGELRPGERVPSTREITAAYGVAMATATRVLAALREDGLVRPVAGVGTVVAVTAGEGVGRTAAEGVGGTAVENAGKKAVEESVEKTGRKGEPELTGERLVAAAVDLADREGIASLSMRRVAARLGAATMSLYRHVPGKDDLVLRMIDTVMAGRPLPDPAPEVGWRVRLETVARLQWELFREHPWLAGAMSMTRPQLLPSAIAHTEWMLRSLDGHGLTMEEMLHASVTLFGFVRGIAVSLEPEAEQRQHTGITDDEWLARQADVMAGIATSGRFPMFARVIGTEVDLELGTLFEFGLARMLDGIGEWISARAALNG
ncbi:AcrR family transcriptional regulator [Saccharothrix tamanrassetensis]|uniref:AcrR family transcriptional regulator n=1 Tax=Saccharothrix tamanrassetensis TaxID=1051531 RepID=A0A841CL39_9PSEU|nr:TetR/AcrR family transcriptional regulator C-terminal domain-containing protein [Saccharothrix tamanrassetensis]MBB5959212.1 AcrR family transcriptional regulator [Saccharothrix tamanrassetensis]